jgi:hypothetical protein
LLLGVGLWGAGEEESLEIMSTKKMKINTKYVCMQVYLPLGALTVLILNIEHRIGNPYYPGYVAGTVVCREYSASFLDIQQLRHLRLGYPRGMARISP